ncbi:MAG: hypothetical protein D3916_12115 [Candidatus Electrothrix sp. MAN1_4]|nr:hypothetical protein [Candidatus Electrothrix sp. MAN1_4]
MVQSGSFWRGGDVGERIKNSVIRNLSRWKPWEPLLWASDNARNKGKKKPGHAVIMYPVK